MNNIYKIYNLSRDDKVIAYEVYQLVQYLLQ